MSGRVRLTTFFGLQVPSIDKVYIDGKYIGKITDFLFNNMTLNYRVTTDQVCMAVCFWYLEKHDLSYVRYCTAAYTSVRIHQLPLRMSSRLQIIRR